MNERDESLLLNIKDDAELLLKLTDEYDFEHFLSDEKTKLAVSMLLIKIGESVKKLSESFKQETQEIEWREIIGLRDIAVHNYDGLNMDWIWENVTTDVPDLLERVKGILHAEGVEE